jgi:hypothetical protein
MLHNLTITAGQTVEFFEPGDFFRVMEADNPLTVIFYSAGKEVARADGVLEGYAERFRGGQFDRVWVSSATTQVLQLVTRLGNDVAYDKAPTGATTVTNTVTVVVEPDPVAQAQRTVTNASAQMIAANATRRYLFVQNNDATGVIYLNVAGAAATVANGIRILPGESFEMANPAPSAAIFAIGSIASNANVISVEG